MKEIELLKCFEKDFIEAGKLAKKLRKGFVVNDKFETGVKEIDIVTSSDLAVQEFVLQKLVNSDLSKCEMVAEEDTTTKKKFAKNSDLVLTLDPIDGTRNYATGKKMYSIIVTLHDKNIPLYTFDYFPEIDWGFRIVGKSVKFFGKKPDIAELSLPQKLIGYTDYKNTTDPKKTLGNLLAQLVDCGYCFKTKREIGEGFWAVLFFILGITDGLFIENPSAVDGLVGLHYGLANGYKVYRDFDISKPCLSDLGGSDEYKGYYLILRCGE